MLILKHVEYEIPDLNQLNMLLEHLDQTASKIKGISFNDIFFAKNRKKFVILLGCESEEIYLKWRKICPPHLVLEIGMKYTYLKENISLNPNYHI